MLICSVLPNWCNYLLGINTLKALTNMTIFIMPTSASANKRFAGCYSKLDKFNLFPNFLREILPGRHLNEHPEKLGLYQVLGFADAASSVEVVLVPCR